MAKSTCPDAASRGFPRSPHPLAGLRPAAGRVGVRHDRIDRLAGVELNEEVAKQHLRPKSGYFDPTPRVGHDSE